MLSLYSNICIHSSLNIHSGLLYLFYLVLSSNTEDCKVLRTLNLQDKIARWHNAFPLQTLVQCCLFSFSSIPAANNVSKYITSNCSPVSINSHSTTIIVINVSTVTTSYGSKTWISNYTNGALYWVQRDNIWHGSFTAFIKISGQERRLNN
jgi:hypothetical protein